MKIVVVGDVHGKVDLINKYIQDTTCDLVLSCGDFGIMNKDDQGLIKPKYKVGNFWEYLEGKKEFLRPIYAIQGNHENFDLVVYLQKNTNKIPNFTLMEKGSVHTIEIPLTLGDHTINEKITVGGLGGNYSPKHWESKTLTQNARRHFTKYDVGKLVDYKGKVDILLLHDVMDNNGLNKINFSTKFYDLLTSINPEMLFLGHFHFWGYVNILSAQIVILPKIEHGYFLIDTIAKKGTGVRFDILNLGDKK